ncbi:hypothetical protein [Aquibacillus saliphilus]|uniref:hypothetical protein n=1 Tax=Aquibacillus saliphilus TaxID=1909422 RepID=UPI001CF0AFDD|nr:hypothetical protein [Aquibacillus saliphilus]
MATVKEKVVYRLKPRKASIILKTSKHLSNTYSSTPYNRFKTAVMQFIGNDNHRAQSTVSKLYGVYLGQTKALRKAYEDDELMNVAIRAIYTTFNATKTKKIRNIPGYFNGVFDSYLDDMYDELMTLS